MKLNKQFSALLDMNHKRKSLVLFLLFIAILISLDYTIRHGEQTQRINLTALIENNAVRPFNFPERVKNSHCLIRGPLPDKECTPGAIFPGITKATICVKGYTKTIRSVSVSLKKQIYADYGLSYPQPKNTYEADHLIPLELGGNNDIANLFPEVAEPRPGFHEKDLVENFLNHEVCSGRISLLAAQEQIATDWIAVYDGLTSDQIDDLKAEFKKY